MTTVAGPAAAHVTFTRTTSAGEEGALDGIESPAEPPVSTDASAPLSPGAAAASRHLHLRIGIALERSEEVQFSDKDCTSQSPDALHACGNGPAARRSARHGDFETMADLEIGIA